MRIQSEGADERGLLINVEEEAVIACKKTNLLNEVVDEVSRVNIKPKKRKTWSRPRHISRSVTKQFDGAEEQKETMSDVMNYTIEPNPRSRKEAMKPKARRLGQCSNEELTALERSGSGR